MHRHGYQGRKFGRKKDQRRALLKSLASSLIDNGKIETTLPKAKEIRPYVENLITKAKKGGLHNRRQIIAQLANVDSAHKLLDEIAPKLSKRNSGYLRIVKTNNRHGDLTQLAEISFVDDLKQANTSKEVVADKSKPKAKSQSESHDKTQSAAPTSDNSSKSRVASPQPKSADVKSKKSYRKAV